MKVKKKLKIVEFPKISIKIKNVKTFYESLTAICLKEVIQPPPDKNFLRLGNKTVRTEIYRNMQICAFQVLWECSSLEPRNSAVQIQNHRPESFFVCIMGVYFIVMLSDLRFVKWVSFFERNCILKWVIFFASFCWILDLLPENLKLIDKLQIWVFNHLFPSRNFVFWDSFRTV